ncbi:PKD domain-containing protein [Pedobacter sp. MC2016-15]|uniref:PKD domain-containing protein n=1 Tax=Pedobacter sp. MC2016-15 TaxID=2994473 RepID=UPI002247E8DC|nr:PKD domain-containing protein [Pedobacter sp. MC2016-15]MCX2478738.1 PKD domain-containing protein [Pedobacter sp. MC2016-15]
MRKVLHALFSLVLVFVFTIAKGQITSVTVDPGPYTPNSTIAATFTLGPDCIGRNNVFQMYLSDANGNFVSATPIGTYTGFYSTYVNGIIPTGTPTGTGYRIRISTNPATTSLISAPFSIVATGTPAIARLTSISTINTNPVIFGSCNSSNNASFRFVNESNTGVVTVTINNELTPGAPTLLTYTAINDGRTFSQVPQAHFTVFARAVMPDGTIGTQAYFLVNNRAVTAFSTTGTTTVCFPNGLFQYNVDVNTDIGIKVNFPGNTYLINWGDGTSNEYTFCDIQKNNGQVQHTFTQSSCGLTYSSGVETTYNAFGVNVGVVSPFCGRVGAPLSTPAIVVSKPDNRFSFPAVACLPDPVTFVNQSLAGQKPNSNSPGCTDNTVYYNWYVDGVLIAEEKPRNFDFVYTFPTKGQHMVRLTSLSEGGCQADPVEFPICIQDPPAPGFTLPATTLCLSSATLTPTNTSVIDNTCTNVGAPVYTWAITPPSGATYNVNGFSPTFNFTQIGVYSITLNIQSATCNRTTAPQEIVVNSTPQTTMSANARLCSKGGEFSFGPNGGITRTVTTGTAAALNDTYTWTVTGGTNYSFDPSTPANSQYPKIIFTDYGSYTVTLVHKNNCNPTGLTTSQTLTFLPSPSPVVTVDPTVCYGANIDLIATINNNNPGTTFSWSSSGNGTFSDPASLTPTYTPSAADLNALSTTITLLVNTGIPGECELVSAIKTVTILPDNTGTNTIQNICSGQALAYTPESSVSTSSFRWTAVNADGNAQPGTYPTSGIGDINASSIINTSSTARAQIIYTITPVSTNGVITCNGVPFTLTVNVDPLPVLTASPGTTPICSGEQLGITMTSNLPNTLYTWSSTVTGVTDGVVTGNVPQPTPLNTDVINNRVSNTGTTQATVTYTITPHYNVTAQNPDGCIGDSRIIEVKIDPALTVANAGQPEDICDRPTYTLNGNTPVVGTGLWTSDADNPPGVTFNNPALPNATVSGLIAGQDYTFIWTISAPGACNPTSSEVTITVNTPTNPGQTSTVSTIVCEGTNSGTITLSGNNGTVLSWESSINNGASWQPIANTTSTLNYTNIVATTQYRAVVQNGQCAAANSTITTITVTPATTIANAGADQTLCNETTVQLNAISALKSGETGLWTVSPNLPNTVIVNPTNPSTQVNNLAPGTTYTFTWTITGPSPCGPTNDAVTITDLLPLTNSISSTSTEVCYNQVITITGSSPTGGNGTYAYQWEASSDGTNWGPINGQTGKDLSFQLQSTQSFRRVVSSSSCTAISNVIRVIAQPPIANNTIAANQTICTGIIPAGLTGSIPTGSDGNFNYQWQSSTNGSTWTDINAAVFATYAPPALTTTTLYRRIVSTITCNGDLRSISNTVTITVRPNAEAEYTYTTDQACAPFVINANNVKAVPYPDRNATYSWYANDQLIGTGITFPGYTITTSNTSVTIKLVTTASTGCQPDEMLHDFSTSQAVTPSFTQSAASGCGPLVVNFVNTSSSLQGVTFRWDFGNGQTSSQTMPGGVTFQPDPTGKDTTYTVRLTAITVCGTSSTTSTVFIKAKPISIFSPSRTVGCSPMTVTFTNTSPGSTNTYYYDFGDGTLLTKTDKSPVSHTFITNVVRDYTVKMVSENECGRDESSYTIRVSPNTVLPELVVNANEQTGCAPFTVNFYNNSRGANLFRYDFGDGSTPTITRTAPEVVRHTFTTAGTYTVTLTASNGCSDTTTTEQITVLPQPITGFSADVTLGCPGLAVQFRNTSVDGVSYLWDFGDGSSSTEFQPRHVFSGAQEYYTVSLTATNSLGCTATTTLNQYIHVVPPPTALFNVAPSTVISIPNYTFRFEDESTNNPTIWAWDFGDGTTSSLRNPSHTYPDTGKYVVTLRVSNQQGCFTTTFKTVTIVGVPGYLFVPNSFMPGSPTPELRTFIAKGSGIKSWKFSVFNKWGQTLWETTELNEGRPVQGWDGTYNGVLQPQGVYFWKIDVEFVNGSAWKGMTYDSSAPKKTGVIHLIR